MLLLVGLWGSAVWAGSPEDFVRHAENAFDEITLLADRDARAAACAQLLADGFDVAALANVVADRHKAELDPALASDLGAAVATRITAECAASRMQVAERVGTIVRIRETDFGPRVITQYPGPDDEAGQVLVWSLIGGGPWGYRAIDLRVDGRSLALTLRDEFHSAVLAHERDLGAAISDLREAGRD